MRPALRRAAILGGIRIPFARASTAYRDLGNLEMLVASMKGLVDRFALKGERVGEVAAGAVIKHPRDAGLTREAVLKSGLDPQTPAFDLQRACGTSLSTVVALAHRIEAGEIECAIAGGVDSASDVPITYGRRLQQTVLASARGRTMGERLSPWLKLRPRDLKPSVPAITEPSTGLSMGEHCELMAKEWKISRRDQDELAASSHQKASKAWNDGFFGDLVVPCNGLEIDNNLRADSTAAKLGTLKPAFDRSGAGTLTAGNSTPLTDGAACVLLASEEWARARGIPVLATLSASAVAAVDYTGIKGPAEGLLMAPTYAVPQMLERLGIALQVFDIYEIHEAFAAQVLCTLAAWESEEYCKARLGRDHALGSIDRAKLNPKGSSVGVGHPFGATGARIVATLAKQLAQRGSGRGLVSICTAGGMGVTAVLEC